ncbi:MAG: site-2 protease family protein [Candidatus Marinimicrobia bacterium]|jgi:Zn-dependent protease|nr:site-2 protease family protein [Candidatus Neomarinimicrobiota bacterium]MBT3633383.1 site-2 protease family protein [Candidatus Neomarinimicrobiota bacterium]MBT3681526.1 site-2 protease family protein [Candidatus Neomarinimicrobiota bacterium]MBT3758507.1 site-2 protease family protein [Candidatus Neomarinimicrobiota bacterium]MBT3894839.1 site-2 protease family protein [Candidatus Neomarinimicrobiota bacterium]
MLFRLPAEVLVLLLPSLLFALSFHEFAHAYMAYKLGDETAARMGRLTINPIAHIDPMGALMILFVGFGWAKPVPVNSMNLRNPRTDMMKVAFAGPASNLLLALAGGIIIRFMGFQTYYGLMVAGVIPQLLAFFVQINIMLAVFNMIPIPPLDGSQIFAGIIARKNPDLAYKIQMHGPKVLMGVILLGMLTNIHILGWVITPFLKVFMYLFAGISF